MWHSGGRKAEGETWPRGVVGARPISALFGHWGQWVVGCAHLHAPTDVVVLGAPSQSLNTVLLRAPVAAIEGVDAVAISHAAPVPGDGPLPVPLWHTFPGRSNRPYGAVPPTPRSSCSICVHSSPSRPSRPTTHPPSRVITAFLCLILSYTPPVYPCLFRPSHRSNAFTTPCSLHGFLRSSCGLKAEETFSRRLTSAVLKPSLQ